MDKQVVINYCVWKIAYRQRPFLKTVLALTRFKWKYYTLHTVDPPLCIQTARGLKLA